MRRSSSISKLVLTMFATLILLQVYGQSESIVAVTRNYVPRKNPETVTISFDWQQLLKHAAVVNDKDVTIKDGNFGTSVTKRILDQNSDGKPDQLSFTFIFHSDEPIFTFRLSSTNDPIKVEAGSVNSDQRLIITYLTPSELVPTKVSSWPDKIIESTMALYPDPSKLPIYAPGNWSYEYAFFLNAMINRWKETKNAQLLAYAKRWADRYLDSHGAIDPRHYNVNDYRLDDILPGRLFIFLYDATKDSKYKNAATQLRNQLKYQPRTNDGGYWHKQIYPHQMWLDGIYMADVFSMQYAAAFNEPDLFKESMQQIRLITEHNTDPQTGLLYHGWDESLNDVWANQETGTSPEFWSRGIGWYLMAILDCIDYVPLESLDRKELGRMFQTLARKVIRYQDPKSGLWFQVTNKSIEPRNWVETSASAMFAYAFAKGFNKGILDKSFLDASNKAFTSLKQHYLFLDDQGHLYMDQTVKIGTLNPKNSKGDFDYYVTTERRVNDYKGLGALLYLSMELD